MSNPDIVRSPFQNAERLFTILSIFYKKEHVHALFLLFSSFREIDDHIDTSLQEDNRFNQTLNATQALINDSFSGVSHQETYLPEELHSAENAFIQALSLLDSDQHAQLQNTTLPPIITSWKLDKEIARDPFAQTQESLQLRHATVILPFLDMIAICLYNSSLSDEDFYKLTGIASAWSQFDWLEDLEQDLPESIVHISPELLNTVGIYTIDDLWNITPQQFETLKETVIIQFKKHLHDILAIQSWPFVFKCAVYLFFVTRMISCWRLKFPFSNRST